MLGGARDRNDGYVPFVELFDHSARESNAAVTGRDPKRHNRSSERPRHLRTRRLVRRVASARSVALLTVAVLMLLLNPQRASAHAVLVGSDPANGATVAQSPSRVRLWFSEEISDRLSTARLVDRKGSAVAGAAGAAKLVDPRTLEVDLPALTAGSYGVLWEVLAEDDGHTTSGVIVFDVGLSSGSLLLTKADRAGTLAAGDVVRRWVGICMLAGLIGALAVAALLLGAASPTGRDRALASEMASARRRILVLAGCAAALGALVGVADVVAQARHVSPTGRSLSDTVGELVSSTRWGHLWIAEEVVLLALAVLLARVVAGGSVRWTRLVAVGAGVLVLFRVAIEALGSHAAAVGSGRNVAIGADAAHILAACVWLGALPALAVLLVPRPPGSVRRRELFGACRGRFAALLSASVALVLITGLYSAGREVDSADSLWTTTYGRALLVKTGLLVVLSAVAILNALGLHGAAGLPRGLRLRGPALPSRRLVMIEAGVGVLLLVAVAVLVESAPPRGAAPAVAATEQASHSGSVADLVVTVSVTPNEAGVNGFTVVAGSSYRPPPAPIDGVTLRLSQNGVDGRLRLRAVAPGRYFGTGSLASDGALRIDADVARGGKDLTVSLPWTVGAPGAEQPAAARTQRLAPIVDGLALGLVAAVVGAGMAWARHRSATRRSASVDDGTEPTERVLEPRP